MNPYFLPAAICLPRCGVQKSWSVIACDQYTSEPEYWEETRRIVGDDPSTLHMIFPEIYLEEQGAQCRIEQINETMRHYRDDVLCVYPETYVYIERTLHNGKVRRGLLGLIDLEQYDFHKGSNSPVRATEGTVLSRIPPRVKIRENAVLELPHVMLLYDDAEDAMFQALCGGKNRMKKLYDTDLMQQGGHITGWALSADDFAVVDRTMQQLGDQQAFSGKYGVEEHTAPLIFAVGDGNHSLATAKQCYENLKARIGAEKAAASPARYALTELVNIHDASLEFEPIYRVLFGADAFEVMRAWEKYCPRLVKNPDAPHPGAHQFQVISSDLSCKIEIPDPAFQLPVGTLQAFLDDFVAKHDGVKLDYIHGVASTKALASQDNAVGFLFDGMEKSDLFRTVILDGALPRKTFSMGEAHDKRYYLECRVIQ